jgi:hypothetical protein
VTESGWKDAPEGGVFAPISHSRASCEWSRATERHVACRRLLGQLQVVLWPFRVSDAAMRSRKTRGQPTSLRWSCRCANEALLGLGWCDNNLNVAWRTWSVQSSLANPELGYV